MLGCTQKNCDIDCILKYFVMSLFMKFCAKNKDCVNIYLW